MDNQILKEIIKRSKLKNNFFKKQGIILISLITINKETFLYPLYEKKMTKYFANLNINEVTDKHFCKSYVLITTSVPSLQCLLPICFI